MALAVMRAASSALTWGGVWDGAGRVSEEGRECRQRGACVGRTHRGAWWRTGRPPERLAAEARGSRPAVARSLESCF